MLLDKSQFHVLTLIEKEGNIFTQRDIARLCGMSLGAVNKAVLSLTEAKLVDGMRITAEGYTALQPYRVKRAVFLAAGFGSRLVPITLNTPKPLVLVNGKKMIETLLDAVVKAGIEEIIIVRGYLGEQFDILLEKYPNIKFVQNNKYNEENNISSAFLVKDLLSNAYVLESDFVLSNDSLITKYQYCSNYLGVPVAQTDDWCFKTSGSRIVKLSIGGTDCFHTFGISYWSEEDGAKLGGDIDRVYRMPGGKERYWDQVALEFCLPSYDIKVRPCTFDDIVEIDTLSDLRKIDKHYVG